MNYLLCIVLFTIGFSLGLPAAFDPKNPDANIRDVRAQIVSVEDRSPAYQAGIQVGDAVKAINNQPLNSSQELKTLQTQSGPGPVTVILQRGTRERSVSVEQQRAEDGTVRMGIGVLDVGTRSYRFPESLWQGTLTTIDVTGQMFVSFGNVLRDLVTERKVSAELSGPVGIVVLTGQASDLGVPYLLQFVGLLSATLAVINFLPFPALDGGRALFVIIEAIRGRAVDQRIESLVHAVGFYVLLSLVLLVSIRDVQRFEIGNKILQNLRGVFGS